VTYLVVHIFDNKTNTVKTRNSSAMVYFLPSLSIMITVTNKPENIKVLNVLIVEKI